MEKNIYNEKSIESLTPLEFTRLKPGVYCGDTTYPTQLVIELFSNVVDEFVIGHGKKVSIQIDTRSSLIVVTDEGQGFLIDPKQKQGKSILEAAFSVLNTSGKYREDGTYEGTSLGAFGIGAKLPTFLSHNLRVCTSTGDGITEEICFIEGVFASRKIEQGKTEKRSGTSVQFKPSEEFFTNTTPDLAVLRKLFKETACLCPGFKIELTIDGKTTECFESTGGLSELVSAGIGDKELIKNRCELDTREGKYRMNMCLTYITSYSSTIIPYVNYGLTESGNHLTAFKATITRELNKFARAKGFLKEKDKNLEGSNLQEGLYVVFNLCAPNIKYDAQIKSRVTSTDLSSFISQSVAEGLNEWCESYPDEIKLIIEKALAARKASEAAKKAREASRVKVEKKQAVLKLPSKLSDCYSKERNKCEIFITEGMSASGGMKEARNNEFQAVLPVRGKILNVKKTDWAKMVANAEILDMINAFGGELDNKNHKVIMDEDNLRYDKIIIAADADIDGGHIATLFYTFIVEYMPQLIEQGHIYTSVPPLYRITIGKKYKYIQNEEGLEEFKKQNMGKKYLVNRLKGLGEMDPEELGETLLDRENRELKQLVIEDMDATTERFEQLMGSVVTWRKELMETRSSEVELSV